ncbi:MAG: DUF2149 domain-containing protein [Myxococcales bacterium]
MRDRRRFQSRFDDSDADPLTGMANLADVMLVFACGLITALVMGDLRASPAREGGGARVPVEQGREVPDLPQGEGGQVAGYESVGTVYRDSKTGKLVMVKK